MASSTSSCSSAPGFAPLATNGDTGGRGWLGTVQVGYDAQLANWVVGIFGDYDWSNIKGTVSDQNTGLNFALKQSSAWSVGGRIGYLVVPQFLTYFSGGYTEANFRGSTGVCTFAGCGVAATLPNHTFSGYFLGGGTEYAFSWFGPGWTIKTEYRLAEFSRDTFAVTRRLRSRWRNGDDEAVRADYYAASSPTSSTGAVKSP